MENIEEKSGILNFKRFQFAVEFLLKVTLQHSFCEMKDLVSWFDFLYLKRPNSQIVLRSEIQSVWFKVGFDNLGKLFIAENF